MKSFMIISLAAMVSVLPAAAGADIYSWTDSDGIRHFSNVSPPVDAQNVTVVPSLAEPDIPEAQAGVDTSDAVFVDEPQPNSFETDEVRAPDTETPGAIAEPEEDYIETTEPAGGESDIYGAVERYYDTYPAGLIVYTGGSRYGYSGKRYSHRYPRHRYKHYGRGHHRHKYKHRYGGHRYYGHGRHYHKYKHRSYLYDRGYRYKHRSHKYDYYKGRHYKPHYYRGKSYYRDRHYHRGGHYRYGFSGRHGHRGRGGIGARIYIGK